MTKTATTQSSPKAEKISLSIAIPADHHRRIRLEAMMLERSAGSMIEEWVDQNVSPDGVITLEDMIEAKASTEVIDPTVKMCGLTTPISKRHHALLRLESFRTNTPIRSIVRQWIEENTKEWRFDHTARESAETVQIASLAA